MFSSLGCRCCLLLTFCSYPKGGTFTTKLVPTNVGMKNEYFINHNPDSYRDVFGTRKPAFWVGAVIGRFYHFRLLYEWTFPAGKYIKLKVLSVSPNISYLRVSVLVVKIINSAFSVSLTNSGNLSVIEIV